MYSRTPARSYSSNFGPRSTYRVESATSTTSSGGPRSHSVSMLVWPPNSGGLRSERSGWSSLFGLKIVVALRVVSRTGPLGVVGEPPGHRHDRPAVLNAEGIGHENN